MGRIIASAAVVLALAIVSPALADGRCGEPPPVANTTLKTELEASARLLSARIGAVGAKGAFETSRQEIYSKYPKADVVRADAYYQYQICLVALNTPGLMPAERVKLITDARRLIADASKTNPAANIAGRAVNKPTLSSAQHNTFTPPPSVSIATTGQQGGVNAAVINGNVTQGEFKANRARFLSSLQQIYSSGSKIVGDLERQPLSDESVSTATRRMIDWVNGSYDWTRSNMTEAAAESFTRIQPLSMTYAHPGTTISPQNEKNLEAVLTAMPLYLRNVQYLMQYDTMDPQPTK